MKRKYRRRIDVMGRVGFVARAITYAMVGILAIQVAAGKARLGMDREGVFVLIAAQPFGKLILSGLACGFLGYAAWRIAAAAFPKEKSSPWKRLAHAGSGLFHGGIGVLALVYLVGTSGEDQLDEADLTAMALELPLGPWIIGAVGAAFLASAGWALTGAITRRFRRHLEVDGLSTGARELVTGMGIAGLAVRALVHALIGLFLVRAGLMHDPAQAMGWNESLQLVRRFPLGGIMLTVVAAGLIARGAFEAVQARYRKRAVR